MKTVRSQFCKENRTWKIWKLRKSKHSKGSPLLMILKKMERRITKTFTSDKRKTFTKAWSSGRKRKKSYNGRKNNGTLEANVTQWISRAKALSPRSYSPNEKPPTGNSSTHPWVNLYHQCSCADQRWTSYYRQESSPARHHRQQTRVVFKEVRSPASYTTKHAGPKKVSPSPHHQWCQKCQNSFNNSTVWHPECTIHRPRPCKERSQSRPWSRCRRWCDFRIIGSW